MFYDCVVVGAGPAGSVAGKILSSLGYKVLIIDSKTFPREKLCGGCVSSKIINYIPNIESISTNAAYKAILSYKKIACMPIESKKPFAYFVNRTFFDKYLLESALASGCKFENEKLITFTTGDDFIEVYTNKNTYKTRYLLGADGANSTVRKIMRLKPKYIVKTLQGKINNTEKSDVNIDIGFRGINYYWFFPQNNVCGVSSNKKNINKLFYKYFNEMEVFDIKGYFIPIALSNNNLGKGNILLLGDAACLADPFSLEGIHNAICSAHFAAASILSYPQNPYKAYIDLASKILEENKYSYYISKIVSKFSYVSFSKLSRANENVLSDFLKGNKSSKDLFWNLFKSLLNRKTIK